MLHHLKIKILKTSMNNINIKPYILYKYNSKIFKMMANCAKSYATREIDKNSPELKNLLTLEVRNLCQLFIKDGFEIRVVGGAVRDMLAKKVPKDIDLSTTATPNEMIDICKKNSIRYIETGLQHGTLTVHLDKLDYEITTLRIDKETFGRAAKVEFTRDWYLDAERRDLTVNAMSVDVKGVLYDYFEGEKDLKEGKVRFVGDTEKRIREDYLRILRYLRFYGKIAPDIDCHEEDTLQKIRSLASGLKNISVERIWLELSKIITGRHAPDLIQLMFETTVAENIGLPYVTEKHLQQYREVWSNTQDLNPHPVTLLVTLVDTTEEAEALCLKWKLSNNEKNLACFLATYRYLNKDRNIKFYQDIIVEKSNPKNMQLIKEQVIELLKYKMESSFIETIKGWELPKFPISGADLKARNIKPGPEFGKILNQLKNMWMESYYKLSKEELVSKIEEVADEVKRR